MALTLKVKVEMNEAARLFPQIAKRLPSLTRDAINRTATIAERESVQKVAADLKILIKFIRNRYDLQGNAKSKRIKVRRATTSRLTAELDVYMRGLPVTQVAGAQIKRPGGGVKATGGRFYKGAFRARGQASKRRGPERTPLMLPKIGLRQRLRKEFDARVTGVQGMATFRREYNERISRALARAGVRA